MDNLSTGAQQVLDALADIGPGTVAEIREKTGKAKSTTDKAIRELADAGLIVETDPGDGNPARWSITAPATEPTNPDTATDAKPDPATRAAQDEVTDRGDADPVDASAPGQLDQQDETNEVNTDAADNAHADDTVADSADQDGKGDGPGMPADDSQAGQVPTSCACSPTTATRASARVTLLWSPHHEALDAAPARICHRRGRRSRRMRLVSANKSAGRVSRDPRRARRSQSHRRCLWTIRHQGHPAPWEQRIPGDTDRGPGAGNHGETPR